MLTDHETGIVFHIDATVIGCIFNRGIYREVKTKPESIFKQTIEAQRSIILEQVKTVDDIYDLYGVKVEGSNIETFELTPIGSGGGFGYENTTVTIGHRTIDNAEKVITYFERPSKHKPNGQMIIIVGDDCRSSLGVC